MTSGKRLPGKARSQPTGLYIECPFGPTHHPQSLAVPVFKGPKFCHWRCACGGNGFCPPNFDGLGYTYQQAHARGLVVSTVFMAPKQ